jgi:hypothetical protein
MVTRVENGDQTEMTLKETHWSSFNAVPSMPLPAANNGMDEVN